MKANLLNSIQLTKPKKSAFDLSHDFKFSGDMGNLIPVLVEEALPGDTFQLGAEALVRFAPLLAPIMHRVDVSIHYFFVPNRLIWANWEKFIVDSSSTAPVHPYLTIDNSLTTAEYKYLDYMGVPPNTTANSSNVNALPFAAYQCVYNEYYRDQNLIPEVSFKLSDGNNFSIRSSLITMRKRAWQHDYFTACLPFAQKGTAVDVPLGDVILKSNWNTLPGATSKPQFRPPTITSTVTGAFAQDATGVGQSIKIGGSANANAYDPAGSLGLNSTTINDLRRAYRLQEWLEKNARGGTRYTENILAHFGVRSSDARLNRPEYITGVKSPVVISEVLNTTGSTGANPQGTMAGHGVSVASGKYGRYFCEEHGYIIGVMSIMPETAYQQGIPKHFLKTDEMDYYWPSFANLGEQAVQQQELYAWTSTPTTVFGYIPRYAEYKFNSSRVAGDFRTTLNYWHLGRIFSSTPSLNQTFIECDPSTLKRIFAVQTGDSIFVQLYNKVRAIRPMPKFGTPMM